MAGRIRSIKPELIEDAVVAGLSHEAFRLFVGMIVLADDHGNLGAAPAWLQGQVFHGKPVTLKQIAKAGQELSKPKPGSDEGLVVFYEVGGQSYAHLTGWHRHQRVDNAMAPRVPMPPGWECVSETKTEGNRTRIRWVSRRSDGSAPASRANGPKSDSIPNSHQNSNTQDHEGTLAQSESSENSRQTRSSGAAPPPSKTPLGADQTPSQPPLGADQTPVSGGGGAARSDPIRSDQRGEPARPAAAARPPPRAHTRTRESLTPSALELLAEIDRAAALLGDADLVELAHRLETTIAGDPEPRVHRLVRRQIGVELVARIRRHAAKFTAATPEQLVAEFDMQLGYLLRDARSGSMTPRVSATGAESKPPRLPRVARTY